MLERFLAMHDHGDGRNQFISVCSDLLHGENAGHGEGWIQLSDIPYFDPLCDCLVLARDTQDTITAPGVASHQGHAILIAVFSGCCHGVCLRACKHQLEAQQVLSCKLFL